MISNHDTTTLLIPARRRSNSAVPVLIRVPNLDPTRAPQRRARRRRLRREIRIAGYALLALIPISVVVASVGGRLPSLSASTRTGDRVLLSDSSERRIREIPAVSLSIEPVASVVREPERPVFLPGVLWPVDSTEEDGNGRH